MRVFSIKRFLISSGHCTVQHSCGITLIRRLYSIEKCMTDHNVPNPPGDTTTNSEDQASSGEKTIRVAVIGAPNAGKSSFINAITDHRICPTSRKVHTTRDYSRTIYNKDKSQMVLFDTPGMTTISENKKYNIGNAFLRACNHSIQNSDLIAVVHDVSNSYTRNVLHPTVLETLIAHKTVPSVLIMNKIDMVKSKRILLDLVNILTERTLECKERRFLPWKGREKEFIADMQRPVKYKNQKPAGWPYFSEVFMVSALCNDGVNRVANYIFEQSVAKPWEFPKFQFTDQRAENLIVQNVRAVLLDFLPNEVPYQLRVEMELFEVTKDRITASVNIYTKSSRLEKMLSGAGNKRLKQISEVVVSNIIQLYKINTSLTLNVVPVKA